VGEVGDWSTGALRRDDTITQYPMTVYSTSASTPKSTDDPLFSGAWILGKMSDRLSCKQVQGRREDSAEEANYCISAATFFASVTRFDKCGRSNKFCLVEHIHLRRAAVMDLGWL
jgi:hypothetical protein